MGTTVISLVVRDNQPSSRTWATAAPTSSAAPLIQQISEDHSLVNEQIKAGMITPRGQALRYKNIITRSVGFEEESRWT
jgi:protein phosphatase